MNTRKNPLKIGTDCSGCVVSTGMHWCNVMNRYANE